MVSNDSKKSAELTVLRGIVENAGRATRGSETGVPQLLGESALSDVGSPLCATSSCRGLVQPRTLVWCCAILVTRKNLRMKRGCMNTKRSTTLRYLEAHEVFTLEEYPAAVDPTVSTRTRFDNLQNAVERDQAYRIRRGLYGSNVGIYRDRVPNVHLVAAKAAKDAVVTYHSALEAHGGRHTPFRTVYFSSVQKVADSRGPRLSFSPSPPGVGRNRLRPSSSLSRPCARGSAHPREQQGTDSGGLPRRASSSGGNAEELVRSLGALLCLTGEGDRVRTAARFANRGGTFGVGLELFADEWRIDLSELEELVCNAGRGTYRLLTWPKDRGRFVARWRLYVPAGLPHAEWARG